MDKFMRAVQRLHKGEKGLTGLETAIILIAFVTVAAVFGYAILSAGIFSTEKAKESVYQGMQEAKSTMVITGDVIASQNITSGAYNTTSCPAGYNYTATSSVGEIMVTLSNNIGGEPIDLTVPQDNGLNVEGSELDCATACDGLLTCDEDGARTTVSYQDDNVRLSSVIWSTCWVVRNDSDSLLERGERVEMLIPIGVALANATGGPYELKANQRFTLEIKPPHGAVVTIQKWVPADIDPVMNLY